jgi:hypothetical protein
MNARQVYQALRSLVDEALLRASQAASAIASLEAIVDILVNHQQGGTIVGGTTNIATITAPPITSVPEVTTVLFEINGFLSVQSTTPSDSVTANLTRNGASIGPIVSFSTDANGNYALAMGPFVDAPGAPGSYTYGVQVQVAGGHVVNIGFGSVLAQQVL